MTERPKKFFPRHTYAGRLDEFHTNHAHILAQTQGEARYQFEKTLEKDARSFARKAVARDILVTAVLTTGVVLIGREIKNKTLGTTLASIPLELRGFTDRLISQGKEKANAAMQHIGAQVAEGAVVQAETHLPRILEVVREQAPGIGQAAAAGALSEVSQSLPQITAAVQEKLEGAGVVIAARIMAAIESGLPHMAETFALSLRAIPGLVFFGQKKK